MVTWHANRSKIAKEKRIPAGQLAQQFLAHFELLESLDDYEREVDGLQHQHEMGQLLAQELDALDALEAKKLAEQQATLLLQLQTEYEGQMASASAQLELELEGLLQARVEAAECDAQAREAWHRAQVRDLEFYH